jgi:hypothetical protein
MSNNAQERYSARERNESLALPEIIAIPVLLQETNLETELVDRPILPHFSAM